MNNLILASNIPEGYEYLLDQKMPITSIVYPIVCAVLILVIAVFLTILVKRQHKIYGLCTFAGVSIFMLFNYFLVMILTMFIPSANKVVFYIIAALMSTLVPFMGRLIVIKAFSRQHNTMAAHMSYGVGIMDMKAFVSIINFIIPISNYYQLEKYGVEYFFTSEEEVEVTLQRAENFAEIFGYNYSHYMLVAIVAICVAIYSLAVTVPIYAAFKGKKSKVWYAFAFGMGFIITLAECLFNNNIFVIPSIIAMIATTTATAVICYKLYKTMSYEDEEQEESANENISGIAKTRIPKFKDLDKL